MTTGLTPGSMLGHYRILRRLAKGGMAEIWLAQPADNIGKQVVLKRVLPALLGDSELMVRFQREAEITLTLSHGNIISVFEYGKTEDSPYLVMEYVPGWDLRMVRQATKRQEISPPYGVVTYIGIEILRGLGYVHRKTDAKGKPLGLIHRDISPSNVMVSKEGVIKLVDFGIAKAVGQSQTTRTGMIVGKVGYMSPEQVEGRSLTPHSDLFSAAIVLYELLTGQRLFPGSNDLETLEKVRKAIIPPIQSYNKSIPKELADVIEKALAKYPDQRFESAETFQNALQPFLLNPDSPGDAPTTVDFIQNLLGDDTLDEEADTEAEADTSSVHGLTTTRGFSNTPQAGPALIFGGNKAAPSPSDPPERETLSKQKPRSWAWPTATALLVLLIIALAGFTFMGDSLTLTFGKQPLSGTQTTRQVIIKSEPPGAEIWIDGFHTGRKTPSILQEKSGETRNLELKLTDHKPTQRTFEVQEEGSTEVSTKLIPDLRTVQIETIPNGAVVSLEGHPPCTSPCSFEGLRPSQNIKIQAERKGFQKASVLLQVGKQQGPVRIPMDRVPSSPTKLLTSKVVGTGKITFRVIPWAFLSIDGGPRSEKPLVTQPLNAGPHKIQITNPELGVDLTCPVNITADQVLRLTTLNLNKKPTRCPSPQ